MNSEEVAATYINPMAMRDLLKVLAIGLIVGSTVWAVYQLFEGRIFSALLCGSGAAVGCSLAATTAIILAKGVGIVIALVALIRYRVSRPLLAVIAVTICLWGLVPELSLFGGFASLVIVMSMYSVSYGLFAWIMRIRNSWVVVGLSFVLVVLVRLIMLY